MERIADQENPGRLPLPHPFRHRAHGFLGGSPIRPHDDGRIGNLGTEVFVPHGRFAHPVSGADAPGDHHQGGESFAVQRERVIEPGLEYRRRAPVVLGRAQHHDRVGRLTLVLAAHPVDPAEQPGVDQGREPDQPAPPPQRAYHSSNDSPIWGIVTWPTPSVRSSSAIAVAGPVSPWTTNACRTGPPRRLTQARSSARPAWAESPSIDCTSARASYISP